MRWLNRSNAAAAKRSTSVALGFAGLLLLMGAMVLDCGRQLRENASDSASVLREYRSRDALLHELRTNIHLASTLIRDYLLESDNSIAASQGFELEDLHKKSELILSSYSHLLLPAEERGFRKIHQHTDLYWQAIEPALGWNAANRQRLGEAFLREVVSPRRNDLIQLLKQVDALNERDVNAVERRMQRLHSRFEYRMKSLSLFGLIFAVVLAVAVVIRVQRLEHEAARRLEEVTAARRDLRLLSKRLMAAHEEERRSLSRELHDDVGQSMSAILMELCRLEPKLAAVEGASQAVEMIRGLAETSVAKMRDLSLLLRPSMLDELGLVPALRWQAREVSRRSRLKVRMIADDLDDDLPDNYRTSIYRVVQESLHNCVKHSRASEVRIVMQQERGGLYLSIEDNGVGFDPKRDKGLGLLGIEERITSLGGTLRIDSYPGSGTVLSVYLPSPAREELMPQEKVA